jgi:hypothetical protein
VLRNCTPLGPADLAPRIVLVKLYEPGKDVGDGVAAAEMIVVIEKLGCSREDAKISPAMPMNSVISPPGAIS